MTNDKFDMIDYKEKGCPHCGKNDAKVVGMDGDGGTGKGMTYVYECLCGEYFDVQVYIKIDRCRRKKG